MNLTHVLEDRLTPLPLHPIYDFAELLIENCEEFSDKYKFNFFSVSPPPHYKVNAEIDNSIIILNMSTATESTTK